MGDNLPDAWTVKWGVVDEHQSICELLNVDAVTLNATNETFTKSDPLHGELKIFRVYVANCDAVSKRVALCELSNGVWAIAV